MCFITLKKDLNMDILDIKKSFSENLKKTLEEKRISQKLLKDKLFDMGFDIKQQNISRWCAGQSYPRDENVVNAICLILECSRSDLIPDITSKPHPSFLEVTKRKFPVLGEVAAGKPIYMNEDRDCYVMADSEINADYCLIARGDSMVDLGIDDGDLVFIKQTDQLRDGDVGVVAIDDEATLKRVRYDKLNNQITLISENKKYPPMIYKDEQLDHIHILGKAVFYQSMIH